MTAADSPRSGPPICGPDRKAEGGWILRRLNRPDGTRGEPVVEVVAWPGKSTGDDIRTLLGSIEAGMVRFLLDGLGVTDLADLRKLVSEAESRRVALYMRCNVCGRGRHPEVSVVDGARTIYLTCPNGHIAA